MKFTPSIAPRRQYLRSVLLFFMAGSASAQGRLEDYYRAEKLKNQLKNKVYNAPQPLTWSESGNCLWYTIQTPRGKEFRAVDPAKKLSLIHI